MKVHTLDTNILLHDPYSILKLEPSEIVIPAIVLEELDSKKREQGEVGRNARMVTRFIKNLRKGHEGKLSHGIPLENGGSLRIELNHVSFDNLSNIFGEKTNDNRIIAVTKNLQDEHENKLNDADKLDLKQLKVRFKTEAHYTVEQYMNDYHKLTGKLFKLVSNDGLVIAKADSLGLFVEMYDNDRLKNPEECHTGLHTVHIPGQMIDAFYENEELPYEQVVPYLMEEMGLKEAHELEKVVFPQDGFIFKALESEKKSALSRLLKVQNRFKFTTLEVERKEYRDGVMGVVPKNAEQKLALELLMDPHVDAVFIVGQAGSGKTLLGLASSIYQTHKETLYKKVLAARPVIPMGKDLGYLPGEMKEKLRPWMQPFYDNLEYILDANKEDFFEGTRSPEGKINVEEALEGLKIEIEALTYVRGRSIPAQLILLDEAQNLTPHEVKTIITRCGLGSKVILLGDPDQIDHPYLDSTNNGLIYAIEKLKPEANIGVVKLEKTERSPLAEKGAQLL
ncbi:PhoH family protein [Pontibacillus sp. ALD_SL1]|uniref:PhoH family protein n=1 Tax=Pontibacillus sp. ALD_SL1 TaxID=2777185 RepID=UPI001F602DAE|nr:PhoH family protein [Pontibacillus sp. ALD_SL1]